MNNRKIRIIEAGNSLGLGGTEYVIQLYCKYLNKEYFDVKALAIHEGGERVQLIEDLGIDVTILNGDLNKFADLLKNTDVLHWHGNGKLDRAIFDVVAANKPKMVIQTNVFGNFRESSLYQLLDYDLYISKMILIRRMFQDRYLKMNFSKKRMVLHYPVDLCKINELTPSNDAIASFKDNHQLTGKFVIGRVGRADRAKFDLISLDGFAKFAKEVEHARFLLVGVTEVIAEHIQKLGIEDKVVIIEPTPDFEQLLIYYKSIDIFIAASHIGESFGMVIAEAMSVGIPVVTISTEDKDNAQIELVDNEKTGLVVKRDANDIYQALYYLYVNPSIRQALVNEAKDKVSREYDARDIILSLENLIFSHLKIKPSTKLPSMILKYTRNMVDDYHYRCSNLWTAQ